MLQFSRTCNTITMSVGMSMSVRRVFHTRAVLEVLCASSCTPDITGPKCPLSAGRKDASQHLCHLLLSIRTGSPSLTAPLSIAASPSLTASPNLKASLSIAAPRSLRSSRGAGDYCDGLGRLKRNDGRRLQRHQRERRGGDGRHELVEQSSCGRRSGRARLSTFQHKGR